MPLLNDGTCSYNGVSFTSLYHSRVSAKPVLDEAKRTTTFVEHSLEVKGVVAALTTDTTLASMRQLLTACGGALVYKNKGYGDLSVNAGGAVRDVVWGPIPEILEWIPVGNTNAADVTWKVTTRIPECDNALYEGAIMAFNYEINQAIDGDGYTTITTTGYFEIPMTRTAQGVAAIPDTVDNYRSQVISPPPLGFKREQTYRVSKDKRRCDFTLIDRQLSNAYPAGVTSMEMTQSAESTKESKFGIWNLEFDGTITMAAGIPKSASLPIFYSIVKSRCLDNRPANTLIVPVRFRMTESLFGRESRFGLSIWALRLQGFGAVTAATGMWTAIPGITFAAWQASLVGSANNPFGQAQIKQLPSDDSIVDLCIGFGATLRTGTPIPTQERTLTATLPTIVSGLNAANSWLYSRPTVMYAEESNIAVLKTLPLVALPQPGNDGQSSSVLRTVQNLGGAAPVPGMQAAAPDVIQRPNSPSRYLVLQGAAARMGFRATPPDMVNYLGLQVTEEFRQIKEAEIGAVGDMVIYATWYRIFYRMPAFPTSTIPTLPVETLVVDGTDGDASGTSTLTAGSAGGSNTLRAGF